jgi:hypothetical protein
MTQWHILKNITPSVYMCVCVCVCVRWSVCNCSAEITFTCKTYWSTAWHVHF